jgi:uncharacterized membrane protein YoaK (UPF0700 family)
MIKPTPKDPLPLVLMVLTVTTGLVDAVSVLGLGRVFTANMTGNVVFLGFAIVGTPGLSVPLHITSIAGFLVGAVLGGRFGVAMSGIPAVVGCWQLLLLKLGYSSLPHGSPLDITSRH